MHTVSAHDPLTGLPSRGSFFLSLELKATEAQQARVPLSVLVVDVDGFVSLADRHGEDAARRALLIIAKLLRLASAPADVLARLDEDRFGVMLIGAPIQEACLRADQLRLAVELHFESTPWPITVTVGVAASPSSGEWTGEAMIALADRRCRAAKSVGGNHINASGHPEMSLEQRVQWPEAGSAGTTGAAGDLAADRQLLLF